MQLFEVYEAASNAKINKNKTKLVPLTCTDHRVELENESHFMKTTEQETLTILGYEVNTKGIPKKDLWTATIAKIKKTLEKLSNRNLSFRGKILLAKALILSRIWYAAYLIPLNKKQIAEINRLMTY
jgi:hypothetical protein